MTCYTNGMNGNIATINKKPGAFPKKIIIAILVVIMASIITIAVIAIVNNLGPKYEETGGNFEINYYKVGNFSDMLNLYNNLPNEMSEDYFYTILDKGGINRDFVQIDTETGDGYIATVPIDSGTDFSNQNVEFISFKYLPSEDDLTIPTINDVTFHSYRNGRHDFIIGSSENEYTHSSDGLTNTYDNKSYAIDSYLMTL